MRITDVLFRFKKRMPKGHIWRGKERLYRKVTPLVCSNARAAYELEEKNMFYLRHPYLTKEQEAGHAVSFNHKEKFFEKHKQRKIEQWRINQSLGDRFGFLKVSEKWD